MREYVIYVSRSNGAYGEAKNVWMVDDESAIEVGRRLLSAVEGVDIWDRKRRVALLTAQQRARAR